MILVYSVGYRFDVGFGSMKLSHLTRLLHDLPRVTNVNGKILFMMVQMKNNIAPYTKRFMTWEMIIVIYDEGAPRVCHGGSSQMVEVG